MTTRRIVLVRHGRSSHVAKGLHDLAAFLKWRETYEAAGIDAADPEPQELLALAQNAALVVSSDARRAMESARVLASDREVITSPLLRELSLEPPALNGIRLPLLGWAVAVGVRWKFQRTFGRSQAIEEEQRARMAAQWLIELCPDDRDVIAVTHASFRSLLAIELLRRGWVSMTPRRSWRSWSAWSFSMDP